MMNAAYGQSIGLAPAAILSFGIVAIVLMLVVIALKGYALWHAAKRDEKWWFIIMLIVNTVGILELIYLIFIVKKWSKNSSSPTASTPNNQQM
jgi:methionyl-tRNA synthetase